MWKKVSEELPPPYELVLLQLAGDEYTTGWYAPQANNGTGIWMGVALNQSPPQYRLEDGAVEKWCKIVRPYDDAQDADKLSERIAWLERRNQGLTTILARVTGITSSS